MLRTIGTVLLCAAVAAVLVPPGTAWGGFAGTDVFIASVGHGSGSGGSQWRTTLWIHNPNDTPVNCQVLFLERNQSNTSPPTYNLTVQPGATLRFDDVVQTLFGVDGFGALRVVSSRELVINSRIFNQPGADPSQTQGQFFSAVPATFAIGAGQRTEVLGVGQGSDGAFRYNFGIVEASGGDVTIEVTLLAGSGSDLASKTYVLRPYEPVQFNVGDLGAGSAPTSNGTLRFQVSADSTGKVIVFGSGIANGSQDPSTFEMTMKSAGPETLAYGFVDMDGVLYSGSPNVSVEWQPEHDWYAITIDGVNYFYRNYITVVSPMGLDLPVDCSSSSVRGDLLVYCIDTSNRRVKQDFHFIVYRPTD